MSTDQPARRVTLRTAFTVPTVVLLLVFAASIIIATYQSSRNAVLAVTHELVVETGSRVREHVEGLLLTINRITQLSADRLAGGIVPADDQTTLEQYFWHMTEVYRDITSMYFGNAAGGLVNSGRDLPDGGRYVIVTEDFAAGPFVKIAVDAAGRRTNVVNTVADFDARTRSWYQTASTTDQMVWSAPYVRFTGDDMVLTASRRVLAADGRPNGVIGVDISLLLLQRFLASLPIGVNGEAVIIDDSGLIVASSADQLPWTQAADGSFVRLSPAESASQQVRLAAEEFQRRRGNDPRTAADNPVRLSDNAYSVISDGNNRFFVTYMDLAKPFGLRWTVAITIPESDFLRNVNIGFLLAGLLTGVTLAVAIGLVFVISRRLTNPIARLGRRMHNRAHEQAVAGPNIPTDTIRVAEMFELTDAFNNMTARLERLLTERTVMFRELQHRVKNSLVMIVSLIQLEKSQYRGTAGEQALDEVLGRVSVIANLYTLMFEQGSTTVPTDSFIETICASLAGGFNARLVPWGDAVADEPVGRRISVDAESITFDSKQGSTIGLIVNELVTNAFKHGVSDHAACRVWVQLRQTPHEAVLSVRDNGPGLPADFSVAACSGFGLTMVGMLAEQLGGRLAIQSPIVDADKGFQQPGSEFSVHIPLKS